MGDRSRLKRACGLSSNRPLQQASHGVGSLLCRLWQSGEACSSENELVKSWLVHRRIETRDLIEARSAQRIMSRTRSTSLLGTL
jgi:hypothetical protein